MLLGYLLKLEKLCIWLDTVKGKASYDGFVKEGIITRGELRDKKFLSLRRDIVFWSNQGWARGREWKVALKNKREEFNEM